MCRQIFALVLVCLVQGPTAAFDNNPACQQIENFYQTLCSRDGTPAGVTTNVASYQGRPGKRGPPGQKGEVGEEGALGPAAMVDYYRIESEIERKISLVQRQSNVKLNTLTAQVENLKERIRTLELRQGVCDIKYDGKCFWVEVRDHWFSGYEEAAALCAKKNGAPANIYSAEHFNLIMPYLRTKIMAGREYIHLWLGMRYNPRTNLLTLSDGRPALFKQMYPGYPTKNVKYTHMTIVQRIPSSLTNIGFHNFDPILQREGALCEI
ncbi:uncharacterized protein LOC120340924 [Styela clava]